MADLPEFRFHPNPFSSGALRASTGSCECCGAERSVLYFGPVYAKEEVDGICPWCISDGSAAAKWEAVFTEGWFVDSWGDHVELPDDVWDEVFRRTPGIPASWWIHCETAAKFLREEEGYMLFECSVCGATHEILDPD